MVAGESAVFPTSRRSRAEKSLPDKGGTGPVRPIWRPGRRPAPAPRGAVAQLSAAWNDAKCLLRDVLSSISRPSSWWGLGQSGGTWYSNFSLTTPLPRRGGDIQTSPPSTARVRRQLSISEVASSSRSVDARAGPCRWVLEVVEDHGQHVVAAGQDEPEVLRPPQQLRSGPPTAGAHLEESSLLLAAVYACVVAGSELDASSSSSSTVREPPTARVRHGLRPVITARSAAASDSSSMSR